MSFRKFILPVLLLASLSIAEPVFAQKRLISPKGVGKLKIKSKNPDLGKPFVRTMEPNTDFPYMDFDYIYSFRMGDKRPVHAMAYADNYVTYYPGNSIVVSTDYFQTKEGIRVGMDHEKLFGIFAGMDEPMIISDAQYKNGDYLDMLDISDLIIISPVDFSSCLIIYKGYLLIHSFRSVSYEQASGEWFYFYGEPINKKDVIYGLQVIIR